MEVEYIKANGSYYHSQEKGEQDPKKIPGCCYDVCYIKKLLFGRWQIDYYDRFRPDWQKGSDMYTHNQEPNTRLTLYPSGIEEIRWG